MTLQQELEFTAVAADDRQLPRALLRLYNLQELTQTASNVNLQHLANRDMNIKAVCVGKHPEIAT